jgi:hypothetical protein
MRNVALFVEDFAHETFLKAIVQRLGKDNRLKVAFQPYNMRGWAIETWGCIWCSARVSRPLR